MQFFYNPVEGDDEPVGAATAGPKEVLAAFHDLDIADLYPWIEGPLPFCARVSGHISVSPWSAL